MKRPFSMHYAATLVIVAAGLGAARFLEATAPDPLGLPLSSIPKQIGEWSASGDQTFEKGILATLKASDVLLREYRRGPAGVSLFVAYYAKQRAGVSMHSPKNCLPGAGWEPLEQTFVDVQTYAGPVRINQYVIQKQGVRAVVLYWYQNRDRVVASEYSGKLYLLWDRICRRSAASSLVRVVVTDSATSVQDGVDFASSIIPHVRACFGGPRQAGGLLHRSTD